MTNNTSFKRLEEILQTINPKVVKQIEIELKSSCSSDMPSWAYVKIGSRTYTIWLSDVDDRYWSDGIFEFFKLIKNPGVPYYCNEYKQQTCSGYKIWRV